MALNLFAPNFRTPYSIQLNGGIQHEFRPGTVLSVDYLRNRGLHYLVYYDTNHVGAARYLDKNAATNAINTTLANCGVGSHRCGHQQLPHRSAWTHGS